PQLDVTMFGAELPRQPGRSIGIETDRDLAIENHIRILFYALRRAAITGHPAKEVIKRNCCKRHADHRAEYGGTDDCNLAVAPFHILLVGLLRHCFTEAY